MKVKEHCTKNDCRTSNSTSKGAILYLQEMRPDKMGEEFKGEKKFKLRAGMITKGFGELEWGKHDTSRMEKGNLRAPSNYQCHEFETLPSWLRELHYQNSDIAFF